MHHHARGFREDLRVTAVNTKRNLISTLFLLLSVMASRADVSGFGPWEFGMSKDAVQGFPEFGPYVPVPSTGGIETFNANWDGRKANISFLFSEAGLKKIQLWVYEGEDQEKALEAWGRVARYLRASFGPVEFRAHPDLASDAKEKEIISFFRGKLAPNPKDSAIKFQMGLNPMPKGATVYCSFFWSPQNNSYYVFLFFNKD